MAGHTASCETEEDWWLDGAGTLEGISSKPDEWSFVASGLLVCVATICVSYLVMRLWPRAHYPRFFALMAGVAAVSAMYIYNVPGAGFGLGALALMAYIMAHASEAWEALFAKPEPPASGKTARSSEAGEAVDRGPVRPAIGLGAVGLISLGVTLGLGLALATVSAVLVPPAYLKSWVLHPDGLAERIRRGLEPGKEFVELQARERTASEAATRSEAELVLLRKRATDAEMALAKAQDELGIANANSVRSVRIATRNGSRHAGGSVYVGVSVPVPSGARCHVNVSSDKPESKMENLDVGKAVPVQSSKGKYRVVLVGVDSESCTFDVVKD